MPRELFGGSYALFRTESGSVGLVDAACPHLGGHLGHGRVCGEQLVCPFHHFGFDVDGRCVSTGYAAKPPPSARTTPLPVLERNGLILAWWDEAGGPPAFEVPEHPTEGWRGPRFSVTRFRGHPQDTTENSVDIGHFGTLHGFSGVRSLEPVHVEGALLRARYGFVHHLGPLAWEVTFTAWCWGLGYSFVEVEIPALDQQIRLFVLPVPIGDGRIELRLGADARGTGPLGSVGRRIVRRLAHWLLQRDAAADIPIWEHRHHVARPALAAGDGPIGTYRRWARQFYAQHARQMEVA